MEYSSKKVPSQAIVKKPYYELLINLIYNFISVHFHLKIFRPLMTNFYITKRCNLQCRYCYPPGNEKDMDRDLGLSLLEKIRLKNPAINFTGGEPLLHPNLPLFLQKAQQLNFYPILLSTNAYEIDKLINLLPLIDNLIISLDSTDEKINDALFGIPGSTRQIMKNIEKLASLREKNKFNISLHAVLCPENLDDVEKLVSFCESFNITLSVSPEHVDEYPRKVFYNNDKYVSNIKRLKQLKRMGKPVACSCSYLNKIEKFKKHLCYPFISPRVEPDGKVYFPCYRIRKKSVFLQNHESLYLLMRKESEWMDTYEECRERCFLACYLEVERYVKSPLSLLNEMQFRQLTIGRVIKPAVKQKSIKI